MLGVVRSVPAVRAVICVAAVLSIAGSVGLHPEPGSPATGGPRAGVAAGPAHGSSAGSPHVCQLCVLHFACALAPAGPATAVVVPSAGIASVRRGSPIGRLAAYRHEGRAPPLAS